MLVPTFISLFWVLAYVTLLFDKAQNRKTDVYVPPPRARSPHTGQTSLLTRSTSPLYLSHSE